MNLIPWFNEISGPLLRMADEGLVTRGVVFLLTVARLSGFFFIGPLLGRSIVSWPVRVGLVILLTLIVAPGLSLPESQPPVQQVVHEDQNASRLEVALITETSDRVPANIAIALGCEVALGGALGLAVAIFLSGLKLAGAWLDRHSGLGMGSVLNPEYSAGASAPAELMPLFCVTVILLMQPVNGHLLVIRFVLDTFHAIPLGAAQLPGSLLELIKSIVQQSLILGLRLAMPFVVAMSLLDMTFSWARRTSGFDLTSTALAFRVSAGLLILAATLPGIPEAVSSSLFETLQAADSLLANQT
jgi:flagellar biosynthetic protein FliR